MSRRAPPEAAGRLAVGWRGSLPCGKHSDRDEDRDKADGSTHWRISSLKVEGPEGAACPPGLQRTSKSSGAHSFSVTCCTWDVTAPPAANGPRSDRGGVWEARVGT